MSVSDRRILHVMIKFFREGGGDQECERKRPVATQRKSLLRGVLHPLMKDDDVYRGLARSKNKSSRGFTRDWDGQGMSRGKYRKVEITDQA